MPSQSASSSDSALRLAVDVRRLPWMRRLAADYAFDYEKVAPFFAGNPAEPASWSAAIRAAQSHDRPRADIARMVVAQQEQRDAPPAVLDAARQLTNPEAVAIVTGQQAGLFGGPLFTLLKALTTIRLARRIASDHAVPVVPIFWIDSEDHDWEEVRNCGVLDADLALRDIAASPPDHAGERAVGALRWTGEIEQTIAALEAVLPPTAFTGWTLDLVRRAYVPGRTVSDSFAQVLDAVLGPHGLVVYDASDRTAKPFAAGLFARELEHPGRSTLAAARAGADLVTRGYHMQVVPHSNSAALFQLDGGRRPIRVNNGTFVLGDGTGVPAAELIERARSEPASFSPNVLLRPIVQDTLFPTVCYVAGPNELAYLAQLRGVYEGFGVPMPLIQPRASATLLDSAAVRFITKNHLSLERLQARDEHALNQLLRALLPPSVERAVRDAQTEIAARMEALVEAVRTIDPTLEGKARSVLGRMQHELATVETKILQAAKRRDETLRRQFMHAQLQAFPQGQPQERAVGVVSFLDRYGPALIDRLLDEVPVDAGTHWVVKI